MSFMYSWTSTPTAKAIAAIIFGIFFRSRGAFWVDWGKRRSSVDAVYDQGILTPVSDSRLMAQFAMVPHRPFMGFEEGGDSRFNYTSDLLPGMWRYAVAGGNYFHHEDEGQE